MIDENEVLDLLSDIESTYDSGSLVVVFLTPISDDLSMKVLSRGAVSGVVLTRRPESPTLADDPRVGYCQGLREGVWTLPNDAAPTIVVFGNDAKIGFRMVMEALHQRVRRFVIVEPSLGVVRSYGIFGLAARLGGKRLNHRMAAVARAAYRKAAKLSLGLAVLPRLKSVAFAAARRTRWVLHSLRIRGIIRRARRENAGRRASGGLVILAIGTLGPGGSERQVVNTALALNADGRFRPIVACHDLSDETAAFYRAPLDEAGIEVVDLSLLAPEMLSKEDRNLFLTGRDKLRQLSDDLRLDILLFLLLFLREKPAIVHAFLDDSNVKAGIAAVLADVPRIILSARSVAPDNFALHRYYMRVAYNALVAQPDISLCNNSRAGARDYRRWLGRRTPRIEVVPNGIDFAEFGTHSGVDLNLRRVWGIPGGALVLGSIMRLSEEKQPLLWARVAVEISRRLPDVHFVLGGGGPLRSEVERIVAQARIPSRVHILGQIQNPAATLRALDIFLLTSRLEGLPNVLIEAQAVGVPVVTTPAGGAAEALDPGRTGLVSDDQTVNSVANTCVTLLEDDDLRARYSAAAPDFVRERFSIEAMAANTLRLYTL